MSNDAVKGLEGSPRGKPDNLDQQCASAEFGTNSEPDPLAEQHETWTQPPSLAEEYGTWRPPELNYDIPKFAWHYITGAWYPCATGESVRDPGGTTYERLARWCIRKYGRKYG